MRRKVYIWAITVVLSMGVSLIFLPTSQAVTVSPIRLELSADPGQQLTGTVKILNDERVKRTLYLSAAKFESRDETGEPVFIPGDRSGLVSWINFPASIDVNPLEYHDVEFTVTVPANAEPGGYFAALFASIVPRDPDEGGQVAIQSDVGTLILFRVNGEFPEGDTVLDFNTKDGKRFYSNLPVEFFFRFQNSGADRAKPLGDITIKNIFGRTRKLITSNRGAGNVLPESIRRFDSAWVTNGGEVTETHIGPVDQPELNSYWQAVQYQWRNFTFGRYTANLQLVVNNDSSRTHGNSLAFWVIPWQLLSVIGGAVILVFGGAVLVALLVVLLVVRRRK